MRLPAESLAFIFGAVCGWVFCHPIYSGRQTCERTSRGHTGFLHLPSAGACLYFYREKDSAVPLPLRRCKSNFVYPRNNRSPFVGHDVKKNPIPFRVTAPRFELTSQPQEGFEVTN